jgi:DNA-binding transcriptional MerR regulator
MLGPLTVGEVARVIEVTDETVRRMERTGELRPIHVTKAGWRLYSPEDVERVAAARAAARLRRPRVLTGIGR